MEDKVKLLKYPRTFHIPGSPGASNDDKILRNLNYFIGKEVVITEKMDGENTTGYWNGVIHARSVDSKNHPSRNWVKNFLKMRLFQIPEGWRVCGENVYARHSIEYTALDSYFLGFSIWNEKNQCLSWTETLTWFDLLGIKPVPELCRGVFDQNQINDIIKNLNLNEQEGIVIRLAGEFNYRDFDISVAKWVRANHINTDEHWINREVFPNRLKISEFKDEKI